MTGVQTCALPILRFAQLTNPRRAKAGANVSQMHYARKGIITPEMEYVALRESLNLQALYDKPEYKALLRQHPGPLHAVFVAIGGGGLIAGVASYIKAVRPEVKVIGVQMSDSRAMAQSVAKGERVVLITTHVGATRADFVARAKEVGASELMNPAEVRVWEKLPLLGTGKIDHRGLQKQLTTGSAQV